MSTPQVTNKAKTNLGADLSRESIMIIQVVTDEDGSLKIGQLEEFTDSKVYLDNLQGISAAIANK